MFNIFNKWLRTPEEKERANARSVRDEKERDLAIAEVDKKYGHITEEEYEKRTATINGEPYIRVVNLEMDPKSPSTGFFELDFNEYFVEYLANNGYQGVEPDEIVDNWFNDLCQNIVIQNLEDDDGVAKSFDVTSKEGLIIQRLKKNSDLAEYS